MHEESCHDKSFARDNHRLLRCNFTFYSQGECPASESQTDLGGLSGVSGTQKTPGSVVPPRRHLSSLHSSTGPQLDQQQRPAQSRTVTQQLNRQSKCPGSTFGTGRERQLAPCCRGMVVGGQRGGVNKPILAVGWFKTRSGGVSRVYSRATTALAGVETVTFITSLLSRAPSLPHHSCLFAWWKTSTSFNFRVKRFYKDGNVGDEPSSCSTTACHCSF